MPQAVAPMTEQDLDLLAYDIANMLDKYGYDLDVTDADIRPHLPRFLAAAQETAAARPADDSADAASWSTSGATAESEVHAGRRPRATYMDWHRSQLVNLGATARDEWYWQCPRTGCKVWAGAYANPLKAKDDGFQHIYTAHADWYFKRGQR